MASFISHTVACFIRLMGVLKILYFIAWLWPSYEFISDISDPVIHLSDPPVARKMGGIMDLNRSIEYKRGYATENFIYEEFMIMTCRQKLSLCINLLTKLLPAQRICSTRTHIFTDGTTQRGMAALGLPLRD